MPPKITNVIVDPYTWRWVAYHLAEAGRENDLRKILANFDYLLGKLAATDGNALIADYDYLAGEKDLQLVQSAIRLSAHVLARDPRQLAGQLTGRLVDSGNTVIEALLTQALEKAPRPWLRPLKRSLTTPGGPLIRILEGHTDVVDAVAVTPDGRHVVSGSYDETLRLWDLATGKTETTLKGHTSSVNAVAVTPDGRHLVSGSEDKTLRVWDLATGETKTTLQGHTSSVNAVAITPDGRQVVSGSKDHTLRVWEPKTALQGHTGSVNAVAVTPDGHVVSGSYDNTLRLWDLATRETETTLQGHTSSVNAVAVTPDGRHLVSGSEDKTLRLWDLATGETKKTLQGHNGSVHGVAVTPDGRHVVSGSYDNTVRVWDLKDGKELATFTLDGNVTTCIAAQDNRTIVVGDGFGQLHFLRIVEPDPAKPAIGDAKIRQQQSTNKPKEGGRWRFWKRPWGRSTPT